MRYTVQFSCATKPNIKPQQLQKEHLKSKQRLGLANADCVNNMNKLLGISQQDVQHWQALYALLQLTKILEIYQVSNNSDAAGWYKQRTKIYYTGSIWLRLQIHYGWK